MSINTPDCGMARTVAGARVRARVTARFAASALVLLVAACCDGTAARQTQQRCSKGEACDPARSLTVADVLAADVPGLIAAAGRSADTLKKLEDLGALLADSAAEAMAEGTGEGKGAAKGTKKKKKTRAGKRRNRAAELKRKGRRANAAGKKAKKKRVGKGKAGKAGKAARAKTARKREDSAGKAKAAKKTKKTKAKKAKKAKKDPAAVGSPNAQKLYAKANALFKAMKFEAATVAFTELLVAEPDWPLLHEAQKLHGMAWAQLLQGGRALTNFESAIALSKSRL